MNENGILENPAANITPHPVIPPSRDEATKRLAAQRAEEAQKAELMAQYEEELVKEEELDRTLRAAQAKRDAFRKSVEEATAINEHITADNEKRLAMRKRILSTGAALFVVGLAVYAVAQFMMAGW